MADSSKTLAAQLVISAKVGNALAGLESVDLKIGQMGRTLRQFGRGLAELGLGYKSTRFFEDTVAGAATFEGAMAHIQTASGATAEQIVKDGKTINALAETGVISNTELADSVYNLISAGESEAEALKTVAVAQKMIEGTAKDAADAQATMAEGARLLGDEENIWRDTGVTVQGLADTFSKLQRSYAFASPGELIEALKIIGPTAHNAGIALNQQNAALAILSERGIHAGEAGTLLRETFSKLAVGKELGGFRVIDPITHGLDAQKTLERLRGALPPAGEMRNLILSRLGFDIRDAPGVSLLIDNVKEMSGITADLNHSQGAAAAAQATRMAAADMQLATLANKWAVLKDTVGEALLPELMKVLAVVQPAVAWMIRFADAHPAITAWAASLAAAASAAVLLGGAAQILGVGATVSAIAGGAAATATAAWTAAMWLLDAAMLANPVGVLVGGIALLVAGAYEIIEHWSAVRAFFVSFGSWAYTSGTHLMGELGRGIEAAAMIPVHAIADIAKMIRAHLPFSPAEVGPLKDLHRVRIVETIAATMNPAPVVAQMRRVAAAAAVAVPLAVGLGHGPGMTLDHRGGAPTISIRIDAPRITVNGNAKPADVRKAVEEALESSTDKIATALQRRQFNHDRTSY